MKDLYIVGAGPAGRELVQIIKDIHQAQGPRWNVVGFLDDTEDPLGGRECDYGVVGTIVDYQPKPNDILAMSITAPPGKKKVAEMLLERGAAFETIIHPGAKVYDYVQLGMGCILYDRTVIGPNARVGNFVKIQGSCVSHDNVIGDFTSIASDVHILGYVTIGNGSYLGCNSTILPHCVVEDRAYVGAGSVVLRRVKSGKRVFGNPAREIAEVRPSKGQISI